MKFNKQKIEQIRHSLNNIKEKMFSGKNEKVPKKYYMLLTMMLMLGIVTLSNNIKRYNHSGKEEYKEYFLEQQQVNSNDADLAEYITAESSISTDISNIVEEQSVETMSNNNQEHKTNKNNYIMPIDGEVIKEYAMEKLVYSKTLGMWKIHPGIDIKAKLGTQIKSSSYGTVQAVEQDDFYGNVVKIIDDKGYIFVYSNLDNDIEVNEGDIIKQGDIIGKVGVSASGELSDESHLHFEVVKDETQVNPLDLIN